MTAPSQSPTAEKMRASAAETRVKATMVQLDPNIFPRIIDEVRRSADVLFQAADEIDRLTEEVATMRKALRFYADPAVYKAHPHGPAFDGRDLSFVARAALSKGTT